MAPNHKYRQSFENHNAVSLIFYRRTVSGEHSCLIWSYGERRGEERPPPVLLICNTVIGKWNYHQWPVDDQIRQISVSGSRQVWKTSWPAGTDWLTDRGQDQLIIIQVCVGGTCLNSKCCYKAHHLSNISYVPTTLSVKQHIFDTDVIIS